MGLDTLGAAPRAVLGRLPRLALLLGVLAGLLLGVGWLRHWAGWSGHQAAQVADIPQAQALTPVGTAPAGRMVHLPHTWPVPQQGQPLHYRLNLPASSRPESSPEPRALLIDNTLPGLVAYWQGQLLPLRPVTGRWNQPHLLLLPAHASGAITLDLVVPATLGLRGGLGQVRLGPHTLLWRQAQVIGELRAASTAFTGNVLLAISLMTWMAWLLWPRPELLVLLVAAGCNTLNQNLLAWFGLWTGDNLHLALWTLAGVGTVLWIPLLLWLATGLPWRQPLRLVVAATGAAVVLAAAGAWGIGPELATRRLLLNLIALPLFAWLVGRSLPTIWRQRDWVLLSIFSTLTVLWGLRLWRLVVLQGDLDFQGVNLPLVLAPVLNLTIGLALAARGWRTVRRYRELSLSLAQDVAQARAELHAAAEREQALAVREAAASERLHWMQEIHDGIGSQLLAARLLAARQPDSPHTTALQTSIDEGIDQLRMMVEALSPSPQSAASLLGAVRYRLMPRLHSLGITMQWEVDPSVATRELDPRTALNLQRIVQEALTNILKHAGASRIRVALWAVDAAAAQGPRTLVIAIEDNGCGLPAAAPDSQATGQGLANMHRRAQACGGWLQVHPGSPGTRLELWLPGWA